MHAGDVTITYPISGRRTVVAVEHLSLDVAAGEFVAVIGPSGCGKSTFLKAVADLIPTGYIGGELEVSGRSPSEARLGRAFAFVFQDPVLLPWRSVLGNVRLPLEVGRRGNARAPSTRDPRELILRVGLGGFENTLPHACSGGMRQRAAIARALVLDPDVLLMDEPFAALDEITRERLNLALLEVWSATRPTVLFVTHNLQEAAFLADRVLVIGAPPGRVVAEITVPFSRPRDVSLKTTVEFLDTANEIRRVLEVELRAAG